MGLDVADDRDVEDDGRGLLEAEVAGVACDADEEEEEESIILLDFIEDGGGRAGPW